MNSYDVVHYSYMQQMPLMRSTWVTVSFDWPTALIIMLTAINSHFHPGLRLERKNKVKVKLTRCQLFGFQVVCNPGVQKHITLPRLDTLI